MGKLTDTKLRALKADGKVQKIADGDGRHACLGPKSKKVSWQMAYRFDGKQKILTPGQYPAADLATAGRKCLAAHSQLEEGLDPNAVKKEQKAATVREEQEKSLTFRVVAEQWFAKEYSESPPSTRKKTRWQLNILYPHIGDVPFAQLERRQVVDAILPTQARGGIDSAHRLAQKAGAVCLFAWGCGYNEKT